MTIQVRRGRECAQRLTHQRVRYGCSRQHHVLNRARQYHAWVADQSNARAPGIVEGALAERTRQAAHARGNETLHELLRIPGRQPGPESAQLDQRGVDQRQSLASFGAMRSLMDALPGFTIRMFGTSSFPPPRGLPLGAGFAHPVDRHEDIRRSAHGLDDHEGFAIGSDVVLRVLREPADDVAPKHAECGAGL